MDASTCCLLSSPIASAGGADGASAGGAPSSSVAGDGPLSAVLDRLLSPIARSGPLSIVSGRPLSPIAGGGSSSAISGRLSSPVAGGGLFSAVLVRPSSPVAGDGSLSAVSGYSLSPVPPADSQTLFLTSTPSHKRRSSLPSLPLFDSSLPSLPTLLAHNSAPLTGKRLFDQAFITQRPIASTRQQEELDLSFGQCSCSATVKMNRSWQSELYNSKPICLLEAVLLMSFLFWDDSFVPCTRHIALLAKKLGLTT